MSSITNISSGFMLSYMEAQSETKLDTAELFKRLSFEMGGDGKTITKDQLDGYIEKADSGSITVGDTKLSALREIQSNWDTISNKKDSINVGDLANYSTLLAMTATSTATINTDNSINKVTIDPTGVTSKTNIEESKGAISVTNSTYSKTSDQSSGSSDFNLYNYLVGTTGASSSNGVSQSDLTSYLKFLLSDSANDSDNINEVALVTNLIADFESISNSKNFITAESLKASRGYQA